MPFLTYLPKYDWFFLFGHLLWSTLLIFNLVLNILSKVPQNWFIKFRSQSQIISLHKPCKQKNSWRINFATSMIDIVDLENMKWACFVSRSTTTKILSCPFWFLGKPTMKSILMDSQLLLETPNSCKKLGVLIYSILIIWHVHKTIFFHYLIHPISCLAIYKFSLWPYKSFEIQDDQLLGYCDNHKEFWHKSLQN